MKKIPLKISNIEKKIEQKQIELDNFVATKLRYPDKIKKVLGNHKGSDIIAIGNGMFTNHDPLTSVDLTFSDGSEGSGWGAIDGYDAKKISEFVRDIRKLKQQLINE